MNNSGGAGVALVEAAVGSGVGVESAIVTFCSCANAGALGSIFMICKICSKNLMLGRERKLFWGLKK